MSLTDWIHAAVESCTSSATYNSDPLCDDPVDALMQAEHAIIEATGFNLNGKEIAA